jgi:hypothetical protein
VVVAAAAARRRRYHRDRPPADKTTQGRGLNPCRRTCLTAKFRTARRSPDRRAVARRSGAQRRVRRTKTGRASERCIRFGGWRRMGLLGAELALSPWRCNLLGKAEPEPTPAVSG